MAVKFSPAARVRTAYAAVLLLAVGYCFHRFRTSLVEGVVDDSVRNQLRNLHAIAADYSAHRGNPPTVWVSDLDPIVLHHAGIRPPLNGRFPDTVTIGAPLQATEVDGRRTVVFEPGR
jgi:hypothetical protein